MNAERIYIYKRYERFWHWSQALLIIVMMVTGFEVHGSYSLLGFAKAVSIHSLAAWRLRMHIRNDKGDLWTKAANYHSRTPRYNTVYRADLIRKATKWADWLEARFVTLDVTKEGATASVPTMPVTVQAVAQQAPMAAPAAAPAVKPHKPAASGSLNMASYVPRSISFTINDQDNAQ